MEDDWEKIADENPVIPKPVNVNKWEGEDDEEVKDSWEDALLEEKKDEEKEEIPKIVVPKKTLAEKIAEKDKKKLEMEENRRKDEDKYKDMTPEQITAEKLRLQKLQEAADLEIGLESMGLTSSPAGSIDAMKPETKEEFDDLSDALVKKLNQFKENPEYVTFLDEFIRNICAGLSSVHIRKVKTSLDNLFLEKQKIEKGDKPKKKPGAKVKAKLRMEVDDDYASVTQTFNDYDEYDDFM